MHTQTVTPDGRQEGSDGCGCSACGAMLVLLRTRRLVCSRRDETRFSWSADPVTFASSCSEFHQRRWYMRSPCERIALPSSLTFAADTSAIDELGSIDHQGVRWLLMRSSSATRLSPSVRPTLPSSCQIPRSPASAPLLLFAGSSFASRLLASGREK